jgi:hypothetical protein
MLLLLNIQGSGLLGEAPGAIENTSPRKRLPELVWVARGTAVDKEAPKPWSQLVIKSVPRLASGDLGTLPRSAFRTATMVRTVVLADIKPTPEDSRRFELRKVGIGLCVPDEAGRDVVVSSAGDGDPGANVGLVERIVLERAETRLAQARLVLALPGFAILRAPVVFQVGASHHEAGMYYALLVNENTGGLRVLSWLRDASQNDATGPRRVVELASNFVFDCRLDVQAKWLLGTMPVSWSFALSSLPPGQSRALPANLSDLLGEMGASPANFSQAGRLEQGLRRILSDQRETAEQASAGF